MAIAVNREAAVKSKLKKIYGPAANIQMGYVRLEKVLSSSNTSELFTLGDGRQNGQKRALENFLSQNDNFVPLELKVGLQKVDTTSDNNGNQPIYTYPDLTQFAGVGEADSLEGVFNGTLSIKSDTYEVINKMNLDPFRRVPRTQLSATTQASSGEIEEGYGELDIIPIFEGKKRNEIQFTYAQGANAGAIDSTAPNETVLVLIFKGFIIRNASEPVSVDEMYRQGVLM
jgi:hypothetical protein